MSRIWVPRAKILEPNKQLLLPIRLEGRYIMEAVNVETGRRRKLADFPNLITTNGANLWATSNIFTTCCVGSGNTPPALGDTALQSLVGTTTTIVVGTAAAQSSPPYYGTTSVTYRFAAGVATGNLAEVGVGVLNNSLFSRALILDSFGSPTTITVLSNEALDVTYQLRQYVPTSDVTGTVTIGAVNYNYTLRAARATQSGSWARTGLDRAGTPITQAYSGAIGAVTASSPSGSAANADSVSTTPYSTGSFEVDSVATWGLSSANFGGVNSFFYQCGLDAFSSGCFQCGFNNPIPKDGTKVLTLSFGYTWAINTP